MSARIVPGQLGIAGLDAMAPKAKRTLPGREKLTRKERRRMSGPSHVPHACVLLGIDAAGQSGWAILVRGELPSPAHLGTAATAIDRERAIRLAIAAADDAGLPIAVVGEKWVLGARTKGKPGMSPDALARLGGRWQQWEDMLVELGVPRSRMRRVHLATWRAQVLSGTHGHGTDWKRVVTQWALRAFRVEVGHDAAEALAIAVWGSRAPDVAEVLPSRAA